MWGADNDSSDLWLRNNSACVPYTRVCPRPKIYGLSCSNQIKVDHTVHSAFVCDFHNRNWSTLNKEHEQVAPIQIQEYVCLSSSLWGTSLQMLLLFPPKGFTKGPGAFMNLWWLLHYRSGIVRLRWDHPPTQPFTPTEFCWTSRPPDNPLFFNVSLLWCAGGPSLALYY